MKIEGTDRHQKPSTKQIMVIIPQGVKCMNFIWISGKCYVKDEDGELREATPHEKECEGYHD